MESEKFGYVTSQGNEIAYMTMGAPRHDLLFVPGDFGSFDVLLDEPARSRFFAPAAEFARIIAFDRRGIGMSSRAATPAAVEDQMADVEAVLNAVGSARAAVLAAGGGTGMAIMFAATHAARVSHLIIFHGQARITRAEGYEWAMNSEERRSRLLEPLLANWGQGDLVAHMFFPALATEDARVTRLAGRWLRQSGTPNEVRPHWELSELLDVREILSEVQAPTLVIDRPAAVEYDSRHTQYLAEHIPGARFLALPGRDIGAPGDGAEELVGAIAEFIGGTHRRPDASRTLSTVAFTDIVGSTAKAEALGDAGWRKLLERHDQFTRELTSEHGGKPVKSTGDGFLATFDGPARAVRCITALADRVHELDIELRAGIHTGEVELLGDDVGGIAVHIGARIAALAGAGEVLTSSTVRDLAMGSGIEFAGRGRHELKGVAEGWELYAASYPR